MTLDPEVRRMVEEFAALKKKVERLERGERPDQARHTSWEATGVNNYDDDGKVRQRLGLQSDGTFAVSYANGPQPPTPAIPNVSARELGAVIGWDGTFVGGVDRPNDVQRIDAHVSEVAGFVPDGTTVVGSMLAESSLGTFLDSQTHYVKLVAVTTSDVASEPSEEVEVDPLPATNLDVSKELVLGEDGVIKSSNYMETGRGFLINKPLGSAEFYSVFTRGSTSGKTSSYDEFYVGKELYYKGDTLNSLITNKTKVIARASFPNSSATSASGSHLGIFGLDYTEKTNHMYHIVVDGVYINSDAAKPEIHLWSTRDGSVPVINNGPTTNDTQAQIASDSAHNGVTTLNHFYFNTTSSTRQRRLLLSEYNPNGSCTYHPLDAIGSTITVYDCGVIPQNAGYVNDGGGTTQPDKTYQEFDIPAYASRSWGENGDLHTTDGEEIYQGDYPDGDYWGNQRGWIWFARDTIKQLQGVANADIEYFDLYMYWDHWYSFDGGTAIVGWHTVPSPTNTYDAAQDNVDEQRFDFGRNSGRWVSLLPASSSICDAFQNGTAEGIAIGPGFNNDGQTYGTMHGDNMANEPRIRAGFYK